MDCLLFRVWAPIVSWGLPPGTKERPSLHAPTKSALLPGLFGAALGYLREDEDDLLALAQGYGLAVRIDRLGELYWDFHTALPTPRNTSKGEWEEPFLNRADEIRRIEKHNRSGKAHIGPIVTNREYRVDAHYTACIWRLKASPLSLDALAEALIYPKFFIYFGRKSCMPGAPLEPQVITAPTVHQALCEARFTEIKGLTPDDRRSVLWDACKRSGMKAHNSHIIRDNLVSRRRWQYGFRQVNETFLDKEGQPCTF